jgi:transposase-like protein
MPEDVGPFSGPYTSDEDIPEPVAPECCEKCRRRSRKGLINAGSKAFPRWLCSSCLHRAQRAANTKMMYGRGRRGY